ncbi:MAG: NifU family protein [Cryobacterium sp.]|nr:NifU family protein [Oligoflexia bacterium]
MSSNPVYVSLEFTPNPNTLKYSVNRQLLKSRTTANFGTKDDADKSSPLAAKLFAVPGIRGVMIGKDFVTVTKSEEGDWDVVHKQTSQTLEAHLQSDEVVVNEDGMAQEAHAKKASGATAEIEMKIRDILDQEIRPAVAMDGGDITFDRFENGIVYVQMQGSCAGCPSSTATLKDGIESRLRDMVPEVLEVVSI